MKNVNEILFLIDSFFNRSDGRYSSELVQSSEGQVPVILEDDFFS